MNRRAELLEILQAAEPYLGHLSNCALMTALPTAAFDAFECTCGYRKLKHRARSAVLNALQAESEALGLYDMPPMTETGTERPIDHVLNAIAAFKRQWGRAPAEIRVGRGLYQLIKDDAQALHIWRRELDTLDERLAGVKIVVYEPPEFKDK